ncbi:hypothetical protein SAMN02745164_01975 [Marinitoga hydrogenitolerans DSM 16785]|uniref:Uncharacterized protein n=1 Tax=Marinitoga hydrogenitolerans (strain DSM 16785 / JCM 12826 / AT1271) TaxID=1122195 RepID=A0A1M4ZMA4_MARH1|nr:hypothetical protein [Marinitoga hydrogenitolerans]SHF19220.1 hypothetical protein SAMN02745164_01975 [Marinitoga hydrogenitolerans DSM 16785]
MAKCKNYHEAAIEGAKDGIFHGDHIHPTVMVWASLNNEKIGKLVEKVAEFDADYAEDLKEMLGDYDTDVEDVPIPFPFSFDTEEEFEFAEGLLKDIVTITEANAYSFIVEAMSVENEEDTVPSVFTECKEGKIYLTLFNWEYNKLDEEEYENTDEDIQSFRLDIF